MPPSISEWVSRYPSNNTRHTYTSSIYRFLDVFNGSRIAAGKVSTKEEKAKYEKLAATYLSKKREHIKHIEAFITSLAGKEPPTPAKTVKVYVAAVKEWLIYNHIELTDWDKREIKRRLPKGGAVTIEAELDHEKIRLLLAHADTSWIRCIILMLASSGMRINELLCLEMSNIIRKGKCWQINIPAQKTKAKTQRYTFISSEAVAAFQAWERERARYLNGEEDNRLFPMTDENVRVAFNNILKKAGIYNQDKDTKRSDLTPHAFRKFFLSQLKIGMSTELVEMLAGHNGYLSDAYRRYSIQQVREIYEKNERLVTIQSPKELVEIETEFKAQIQDHSEILQKVVKENYVLKEQVTSLQQENTVIKDEIVKIKDEQERQRTLMKTLDKLVEEDDEAAQIFMRLIQSRKE